MIVFPATVYEIEGSDATFATCDPLQVLDLRDKAGKIGVIKTWRGGLVTWRTPWPASGIQYPGFNSGQRT